MIPVKTSKFSVEKKKEKMNENDVISELVKQCKSFHLKFVSGTEFLAYNNKKEKRKEKKINEFTQTFPSPSDKYKLCPVALTPENEKGDFFFF